MPYMPNYNNYNYQPYQYQPMQYQPAQPQYNQSIGISGKLVDSFDNVTVNDVPMDGNPATFIKKDMSEIQVRMWTPQGTISTTSYKPYIEPKKEDTANSSSVSLESLYDDFRGFREELLFRFDRLDKSVSTKPNNGRGNKREVECDE